MGVCPIPRALHRQTGLDATRLYSYGIYIAIAHVVTAHTVMAYVVIVYVVTAHTVMAYVVMADDERVWTRRAVSGRFHVGPPTRRALAAGMVTKKKRILGVRPRRLRTQPRRVELPGAQF